MMISNLLCKSDVEGGAAPRTASSPRHIFEPKKLDRSTEGALR